MTRVVVLPADETACGYYRMRLPAGAVRQIRPDWDIEVYRPRDVRLGSDLKGNLMQIYGIPDPLSIDLLVMQRVGQKIQVSLLEWARDNGIATVMDTDDAMWCIDPENTAHAYWNSGAQTHWSYIDQAASVADITTVTTQLLANRYGKRGRTEILPNCIPGELSHSLQSIRGEFDQTPTIGWAGFTGTHPGDLQVVGDAVRRVVEDTGCKVRVIGDAAGAAKDWGIKEIDMLEPVPIGIRYYTALTSLDVALVPLQDHLFNKGKSYLKPLEFASSGVPVVATPTAANWELSKTVPILLADNPEAWYNQITQLLAEHVMGSSRPARLRENVYAHHSYEHRAEAWASVWERAMARRSRMAV